jgi:8-oxo-dGTP pyrophosphatase MutT (NUDIX family)
VVVRSIEGVPHALVIRDPYENWGLPKGHLERGEDEPAAALREVQEETGLSDLRIGAELGCIDWYFRSDGHPVHKFCTFFLIHSLQGPLVPEVSEGITECVWLPLEEAVGRISYENARAMVRAAAEQLADLGETE